MLKSLIGILFVLVGFSAYAQTYNLPGEIIMTESAPEVHHSGFERHGMYVGFDYANFTTDKFASSNNSLAPSNTKGFGASLGGVRGGYASTPEKGIGFAVGARYNESLVSSEYGDDKIQFIMPEFNVQTAITKKFLFYFGANTAWYTNRLHDYVLPDLGGQMGLGIRPMASLQINAGLTILRQKLNYPNLKGSDEMDGFNTNISYLF